jgi:hypothetical protein
MKLIMKICLAALLVGFLASPLIAKSKHQSEEIVKGPSAPRPVPIPYPNVESQKSPTAAKKKTNLHDINIKKTLDKSSP